jgi:chromosome segregation protein
MRLEKIKLSGFKSFVDQTVIPITGNLTAIVGPNGCGKSNIIDAIRWVMGESSAKHLRGGNMTDVIFNGCATRKPVGLASVELIFDNSEGKAGGEYAQYGTIAIKRQVSRDGQSLFMLNGARCRRKDITDIFLGTGLGSRSYAIIEQGTISRMVEAKPEELRVHIEEAAGISKYKERRSETETRMRHTRENLERLDDLREEVDKQLKHLQKQAEKAEKYTELKKQERQYKLELLAMRWNSYQSTVIQLEQSLQQRADEHNRLFGEVKVVGGAIETKRAEHKAHQHQTSHAQAEYYTAVAEVSNLEQAIKHNESNYQAAQQEIGRLRQQADHATIELEADLQQLAAIQHDLAIAENNTVLANEKLEEILLIQQEYQQQRQVWQEQWESFHSESARYKEQVEVQRVRINQLEHLGRQLQGRQDKLQAEQQNLASSQLQMELEVLDAGIEAMETRRSEFHDQLEQLQAQIREQRHQVKHTHDDLHERRSEIQHVQGKITSLELLQQHAMGKDNQHLGAWLQSMQLNDHRRLAEFLEVESGWERAVETVLGAYLEAICLEDAGQIIAGLPHLQDECLTLVETRSVKTRESKALPTLQDKVTAPWDLSSLLASVYCADNYVDARAGSQPLKPYESVVTPDGAWFGPGWVKIVRTQDSKTGLLQREKDLRLLKQRQDELQLEIAALEDQLETTEARLKQAESMREVAQKEHTQLGAELSAKSAEYSAHSARLEQQQRRLAQINQEQQDIAQELAHTAETLAECQLILQEAESVITGQTQKRSRLDSLNQDLRARQQLNEESVNAARQQVFSFKSQIESLRSAEALTIKQIERLKVQQQQAVQRMSELLDSARQTLEPLQDEKKHLDQLYSDKNQLEARLKSQRQMQDEIELTITQLSEQHVRLQRELEQQKEALDNTRFELQECKVRQQTVNEQLREINADVDEVLQHLPEQAEERQWKSKVDELGNQIERLGTINLTAIEEYQTQAERMSFLNEQHADLIEALQTLEQAINKIDKESKLRFKETFDKINNGLQEKFPKLFGGGQAYLELSEDNLSESGVNIIARPPGKKNSSIHLLSGGEKALTAVALVFSIFELNPAPFCLLDEVDAPLDDANVGRFSKMVEEMSESVQFLYISHNKVTMEIAKQLAGVTMKEPGVSRMVAVDIEEAVSLAEI